MTRIRLNLVLSSCLAAVIAAASAGCIVEFSGDDGDHHGHSDGPGYDWYYATGGSAGRVRGQAGSAGTAATSNGGALAGAPSSAGAPADNGGSAPAVGGAVACATTP